MGRDILMDEELQYCCVEVKGRHVSAKGTEEQIPPLEADKWGTRCRMVVAQPSTPALQLILCRVSASNTTADSCPR